MQMKYAQKRMKWLRLFTKGILCESNISFFPVSA
jgi:hypothetical protein